MMRDLWRRIVRRYCVWRHHPVVYRGKAMSKTCLCGQLQVTMPENWGRPGGRR